MIQQVLTLFDLTPMDYGPWAIAADWVEEQEGDWLSAEVLRHRPTEVLPHLPFWNEDYCDGSGDAQGHGDFNAECGFGEGYAYGAGNGKDGSDFACGAAHGAIAPICYGDAGGAGHETGRGLVSASGDAPGSGDGNGNSN